MSDLVLKTRLDMLRKNLGEVRDVLQSIEKGRRALQTLLDLLGDTAIEESLSRIQKETFASRSSLVDASPDLARLDEGLDSIGEEVRNVKSELRRVADSAAQLVMLPIHKELEQTLKAQLIQEAADRIDDIDVLSSRIDSAQRDGSVPELAELTRAAWAATPDGDVPSYEAIRDGSRKVFEEYVDLLGGLALRDTGLDNGICRIADEFFKQEGRFGDVVWSSLTIPAREEFHGATMARIIRLGFPEWTIWALPLAAHEFGHVVIATVKGIEQFVEETAADERSRADWRICLADAFATYFMGPAYAWAAILMRFDPLAAAGGSDDGLTQRRVATVLAVLEWLDTKAGGGIYDTIADRLRAEWDAAVTQAGGRPQALEAQESETIDSLIACLERRIQLGRALPSAAWTTIEAWAGWLWTWDAAREERDSSVRTVGVGLAPDIRFLLNAVWLCRARIYSDAEADREERAIASVEGGDGFAKMEQIDAAAVVLWSHVEATLRDKPGEAVGRVPTQSLSKPPASVGAGQARRP